MSTKECGRCYRVIVREPGSIGTGYGMTPEGVINCYACCAEVGRESILQGKPFTGYLVNDGSQQPEVTNWPGTFRVRASVRRGRHNIARERRDVWAYMPDGFVWYGRNAGDSQLLTMRRTKERHGNRPGFRD